MAREFNININKQMLDTKAEPEHFIDDEGMNEVMSTADEIMEVFAKRKTNLEDAWIILASLADSIYMYSVTGEDN